MASPSLYVEVNNRKIGLDNGNFDNAFLSHAHSDHITGIKKSKNLLSSKETKHILEIEKSELKMKELDMRNAGHILGARQLVAEEDGKRTVYTGDIRLRDGILEKGAEIIECDKLIIEATYAKKIFSFPDPFDVYSEIATSLSYELVKGNSVIFASYPLGKAQELIKVVNEYLSLPVVVDLRTSYFSQKYNELGMNLDFVVEGSEEEREITRESFVYITSPRKATRERIFEFMFKYSMPFKLFIATGWALLYKFNRYHKVFPLSDHADFRDLLYYIEQSSAKEVILFGGDGGDLLMHYKNINGIPIKISTQ